MLSIPEHLLLCERNRPECAVHGAFRAFPDIRVRELLAVPGILSFPKSYHNAPAYPLSSGRLFIDEMMAVGDWRCMTGNAGLWSLKTCKIVSLTHRDFENTARDSLRRRGLLRGHCDWI